MLSSKKYPGGARFRAMSEYRPYMTDKNKERYRYMKDKHQYFIEKMQKCETTKILNIDKVIPGTKLNLQNIVLNIRDKTDDHRIFNSIDIHWDNPSVYVITFRPDKQALAYPFNSSLPTYIHHLYPKADLSKIFTMEALDQAFEETYHPDTQRFTTLEDVAMLKEIQDDADDDSMEGYMADAPIQLPSEEDFDPPVQEIRNKGLFDLSGSADSVSTMASDNLSVTFNDDVSQSTDLVNTDQTVISANTEKTTTSVKKRMTKMEEASEKTTKDISSI